MYFTPQQLSGGPKYTFKTRVGNWQEDWEKHETKLKDYMAKKETDHLVINQTQQKLSKAYTQVPQTFSADGRLHFGDMVMLKNSQVNGFMVFDMSDRITSHDEAYAVTTVDKDVGPCARSVVSINHVDNVESRDIITYGQEIRIVSNPYIANKPLYLHSEQISPLAFARFSRNQEVSLHNKKIYNTVWKIQPIGTDRKTKFGQPVLVGEDIMFEHCATSQMLSSDKIVYRNDFGQEFEVSCRGNSTNNKTQMLSGEGEGKMVRENTHKAVAKQNHWQIVTAPDSSYEKVAQAAPTYTPDQMVQEIKETLKKRGAMAIRGISRVFKILDDNRNRQIDLNELMWGLKDFDIHLNEEQARVLLKRFDRDGSGTVNFNEFLVALRGDLNENRLKYIDAAYKKLDVNKDGTVTLEDIAKLYDVSEHPDVLAKKKTPQEAYREFMSMWDTQNADGIVTFQEFCEYFRDVSASIDTDEYFAAMMVSAWKL